MNTSYEEDNWFVYCFYGAGALEDTQTTLKFTEVKKQKQNFKSIAQSSYKAFCLVLFAIRHNKSTLAIKHFQITLPTNSFSDV